jgi:gamma-glutamyltranspeptidase
MAVGGEGSTRIFTAVLQAIVGVLDRGLNVTAAIESPRTHHFLYPNVVDIDSGFSVAQLEGLTSRGHNISGRYLQGCSASGLITYLMPGHT